jgi:hypothetical protein
MKGFPNQVAELPKLATAMRCFVQLEGERAKDEWALGECLVRCGAAGTGHRRGQPVDEYLRSQRQKRPQSQSPRATARGLRELFKILGFIQVLDDAIRVTDLGRQAAAFAGTPLDDAQIEFWRRAIRNMAHYGGDDQESHPYQVLLKLIASKPDIVKPKCALALEAKDDSPAELARIVALADLPEGKILKNINTTESNWKNGVKVLPRFAEQLKDVVKTGGRGGYRYRIADAPGKEDAGPAAAVAPAAKGAHQAPRVPRTSRAVTPETIGQAGIGETYDEADAKAPADPAATARMRRERLRRHNLMLRKLSALLAAAGVKLFADPFDLLAIIEQLGIMVEAKSLDGTPEDEVDRVREALAQLLYYSAFLVSPAVSQESIKMIACFEQKISDDHIRWLNNHGIAVIWQDGDGFAGDALARGFLGRFLEEPR